MCMNRQYARQSGGGFGQSPTWDSGISGANRPGVGAAYAVARCMNLDRNCVFDARRRIGIMNASKSVSPCEGCTRVPNPGACENKNCKVWKAWFLRRWAGIYGFGRLYGAGKKGN